MSFKILISDPLSDDGLEVFNQAEGMQADVNTGLPEDEICKIIGDYDAIVVRSQTKVTEKIIEAGKKLQIIGRAGVGLDNVDQQAATKKGIVVMNVPGGNTVSTAELSFAMLLALSRNISPAHKSLLEGKWDRKTYKGVEVRGKTLGILGVGRIGSEVAKRSRAFDMKVIAHDPYITEEKAKQGGIELRSFEEVLKESDYLTIHTPLNDETRNMISTDQLAMMKDSARIINCARGGIVDEDALKVALDEGTIAGAAFDVYPKEPPENRAVIDHDKTVCTPHLGASTAEAQSLVAVDLAHQIVDALTGKGIRNAANIPFVDPKEMDELMPFILLGEKLGLLGSQLAEGAVQKVEVDFSGMVTEYDVSPVTVAVLKGVLVPHLDTMVNYVNAPVIAKERGLSFSETKSSDTMGYTNVVTVKVLSEKETTISGVIFTERKDPRIVRIDGYHVDMKPFGWHLVVVNEDKPGLIGSVGTLLGDDGFNVSDMTLGRMEKGGQAIAAINIDEQLPDALVEKIKQLDQVISANQVNLK
jgi:D-3-phosphoglycerate dehydrogenase